MTNNVGDNTNYCPECSAWDESIKGIYRCWVCGSPEMVERANEPTAYDDLLRRLREAVEEIEEYRTDCADRSKAHPDEDNVHDHYFDSSGDCLDILRKHGLVEEDK